MQLKSLRAEGLGCGYSARRLTLQLHRSVSKKQVSASKADMNNFLSSSIENVANKVTKEAANVVLGEDRLKLARKQNDVMICSQPVSDGMRGDDQQHSCKK